MAKVFWGVLLALVVFSVLAFVGRAVLLAGVAVAAKQEAQEAQEQAQQRARAYQAAQQRARAMDLQRRRLAINERCVGGTVIRVDGSSYTQVLDSGHVVRCAGVYRLR
jgi:hypothetical protein